MERLPHPGPGKKLIEAARWLMLGPDSQVPPDDSGILSALGLRWEGERPNCDCAVWPDNWAAVEAFEAMATQWAVGAKGATGIRYEALPAVFGLLRIPRRQWASMFQDIRLMERTALDILSEHR